ncbi:Multidrug resistance protein stp [Burkholderia sp. 8Y]|uniref:MFS transporter n=1 Tax=Burkholderia sp. 8Y TaxID=2653133 RepID=UPI0012F239D8|nr:MFS transporter [Burkholderia sp. 8Y]VXC79366.1 Multidrug resistance protein stp [Burkholderia sp. 8Y]
MNTQSTTHPVIDRRSMLLLILLAIFVVPSSISGTAIALPVISVDTAAPLTSLQWVVNAFNLTFACLTLAWGALADGFGRRRCFLTGVVIYTAGSLVSALAPVPLILDVGRGVAGIGAAAVFSCGIALLSTNFEGDQRLRVFALFGTVAGLGVSFGPTIAGTFLDAFGWRSIFYLHAVLLFIVLLGRKAIPLEQARVAARFHFDVGGSALFILALFASMAAIVQSSQWGWGDVRIISMLVISALFFVVFWHVERRQRAPMLDLSLLANRAFVGYCLVTVAGSFGFVTLLTYFPTYTTSVLTMTATQAGLTMLMLTAPMLVCPMAAGKLVARGVSSFRVLMTSLLCLLAGVAGLAWLSAPDVHVVVLAAPLLLVGSGFGLAAGLVDGLALHTVPEQKSGMAAGLVNTFRLGSEAIAVSLYGSTLASVLGDRLQSRLLQVEGGAANVRRWINEVAAGNLDIQSSGTDLSADTFHRLLVQAYDGAFHQVLWLLFSVVLLLTVLIGLLIRTSRKAGTNLKVELN